MHAMLARLKNWEERGEVAVTAADAALFCFLSSPCFFMDGCNLYHIASPMFHVECVN
jgi:hypothetical protein